VEVLQLDVGGLQLLCHSRVIGTGEAKAGEGIDRGTAISGRSNYGGSNNEGESIEREGQ